MVFYYLTIQTGINGDYLKIKMLEETINIDRDWDWVREIEPSQEDIIKFLRNNPDETVWRFGKHWEGDLDLRVTNITDLGELETVTGSLFVMGTKIQSLGNLKTVGGILQLYNTPIRSLGNLKEVGGWLELGNTPLSKTTTEDEIRKQVNVGTRVWL